jgi:hypothetical protein
VQTGFSTLDTAYGQGVGDLVNPPFTANGHSSLGMPNEFEKRNNKRTSLTHMNFHNNHHQHKRDAFSAEGYNSSNPTYLNNAQLNQ